MTLPSALRSVQRQTLAAWECLVLDDGSADHTAAIAERFAAADPRFRVLRLPHRGLVETLNAGIAECRAPVVARMDADDCMYPLRLERQLSALDADLGLGLVGGHVRIFPRGPLTAGRLAYEAWLNAIRSAPDIEHERFVECPLAHPTFMLRTEALRALGYRDEGWPEDFDLIHRAFEAGLEVGTVPEIVLAWRDHGARLSRTNPSYSLEAFMRCRAHYLTRGPLAATKTYTLWGYGPTGRALRTALGRHGRWPRAIVDVHPRRIGQQIHGVPVISPQALDITLHRPVVTAVAGASARATIRDHLRSAGWSEGGEYVCAA